MKISQLIQELREILKREGDLLCIIEAQIDYDLYDMPVGECSVEDRDEHGRSVKFLI